jgi:anti-sigma B factor antagonist
MPGDVRAHEDELGYRLRDASESALSDLLRIERFRDEHGVVLVLRGELDISTAPELERALRDAVRERPGRVLLDLSELGFMDSTGIAVIIRAQLAGAERGRPLRLRRGSGQIQRILECAGILHRLTFEA